MMKLFLSSVILLALSGLVSLSVAASPNGCKDSDQCGSQTKSILSKPYSCLDHLKAGTKKCGVYPIYDDTGNSFPVYCDMKSEPGNAWTLVMSWSTKNRALTQFSQTPFSVDSPVNENEPNFILYRQNLARMKTIMSHSTHWRSTCSFPTHKVDYRDYVRGTFKDFDILTYLDGGKCHKVEYVNIRGHIGIHTTARWWQKVGTWMLHIDSSHDGCGFVPVSGSVGSEDNFGLYGVINPKFRCTANDESTTQWWFGGHI